MQMPHIVVSLLLFFALSAERCACWGQSELAIVEQSDTLIIESTPNSWNDSLTQYINRQYLDGYYAYQLDSIQIDSVLAKAYCSRGDQFLSQLKDPSFQNDQELNQLIRPYETNGYPFAVVHQTHQISNDSIIITERQVESGPYFVFDSLIVRSESSYNTTYLRQLTGWRANTPYDERVIEKVNKKLSELPFISVIQPSQVLFRDGAADLYLYIQDKPANTFDGIVGFQPDANSRKVVFTGDVTLDLQNTLRRGEHLKFRWRRLQEATQNLDVSAALPYIFNSKIGIWGEVGIYRRDTSFTQTQLELAVGYVLGQGKYFRAFAERWMSNQLSENIVSVDDVSIDRYGLAFQSYQFDYLLNPTKGFSITTEGSIGSKRLTPDEEGASIVENEQFQFVVASKVWLPVGKRFALGIHSQGATRIDSTLQLNEYFRIGGLNSLRGFDEESIFARSYGILSGELKFMIDQNSAAFAFFDQGWYEGNNDGYLSDTPFGFGIGTVIGTRNGSFRLVYALGSERNNPILLRNGKIHFGFVNRF